VAVNVGVLVTDAMPTHGSGVHVPAPALVPFEASHAPGDSSSQVNAPETDEGTQHWTSPATVVDVDVDVIVRLVEVDVAVLVVTPTQGSGEQVPGPRFAPPAESHAEGVSSLHVKTSQPGIGRQHWIVAASEVDVDEVVDVVWMTSDELVDVDVEVVVEGPVHGSGVQVPGPTFAPPAESHAAAESS
jgi:hypothetical protein